MKKIIRFTLLLISSCASAQLKTELEGKTFITKIGSVCEETNVPDACAGYNTYFEITFNEQNAIIFEKGISSCKELRYSNTYTTEWMFEEQNKIILKNVEPHYDDGQKIFVDNILIFEDNKLTAKPENKYYGEYVFEILPQKSKNQDEKSKLKDLLAMQQLKEVGRMNECGDRIGKWKFYYPNGKLYSKGNFGMSGEWIGQWKFYHENKKLKANGNYEDGNKIGEWKYYDEQRNLIKTEKY